jgi:hypothetical protein
MDKKDLNKKLSEIISADEYQDDDNIQEKQENQVIIKVKDGLFEHSEIINKKYVTTDGRQLLKEVKFEQ